MSARKAREPILNGVVIERIRVVLRPPASRDPEPQAVRVSMAGFARGGRGHTNPARGDGWRRSGRSS